VCNSSDRAHAAHRWRKKVGVLLVAAVYSVLVSCGSDVKEGSRSHLRLETTAGSDRIAGEYVFTVHVGGDAAFLRQLYGEYGVRELTDLGMNLFLIRLNRDPGLDEIKSKALESGKVKDVQPNFAYRSNGFSGKRNHSINPN
jgi:hypothetical protein